MAPVILELGKHPDRVRQVVISTGQHREMLRQVLNVFQLAPDHDLDVMLPGQTLAQITSRVLERLDPLLALLRTQGQIAVVLDEYGGHAGIVTLEDVIEEIVGPIADEHDAISAQARLRRDGTWSLSALLRPDEVEDLTEVELPESEDYDTIAGLALKVLGRVPRSGDVAVVPLPRTGEDDEPERTAHLTVEHMDGLRIDRLSLRVVETEVAGKTEHGEKGGTR